MNLAYTLLYCQHSYNDFEKGVSLIQGPSSLAGQSCYLSADLDGVVLYMVLGLMQKECF